MSWSRSAAEANRVSPSVSGGGHFNEAVAHFLGKPSKSACICQAGLEQVQSAVLDSFFQPLPTCCQCVCQHMSGKWSELLVSQYQICLFHSIDLLPSRNQLCLELPSWHPLLLMPWSLQCLLCQSRGSQKRASSWNICQIPFLRLPISLNWFAAPWLSFDSQRRLEGSVELCALIDNMIGTYTKSNQKEIWAKQAKFLAASWICQHWIMMHRKIERVDTLVKSWSGELTNKVLALTVHGATASTKNLQGRLPQHGYYTMISALSPHSRGTESSIRSAKMIQDVRMQSALRSMLHSVQKRFGIPRRFLYEEFRHFWDRGKHSALAWLLYG